MSQVAYIVKLDQQDGVDKALTAQEIEEELTAAGMSVLSVSPWSSPNEALGATAGLLSGTSPNPGLGLSLPGLSGDNTL